MKGVARLAITTNVMETINTTLTCIDTKVTTLNEVVQMGKTYKGSFVYQDEDHAHFIEESKRPHVEHRELHWRLLDRTKHGRMHVNSQHVKVEFYIRHGDYASEQQLADMLASEIETMGESICDMSLTEEVAKCF